MTYNKEPRQYFFICNGEGVECCKPFALEDKERAIFWAEYLARANPKKAPYSIVRANMTHDLTIDWENRTDEGISFG